MQHEVSQETDDDVRPEMSLPPAFTLTVCTVFKYNNSNVLNGIMDARSNELF